MMHHIRPWRLFQLLDGNRDVLYRIPSHRGVDSMTIMSLETMCLIAAARITSAQSILELGTGFGYNALNLARNTSASILTVDRERKEKVFGVGQVTFVEADIDLLTPVSVDLVFCDINFTPETTRRATEIAIACSPRVIAWHDYSHPNHPHVKEQLDDLARELDLYHVEDSWLVLWFEGGLAI